MICALLAHLVGVMGGYLHFAFVQHERCPEHGELVHAREHSEADYRAEAGLAAGQAAAHIGAAGSQDDDAHDPCSTVSSLTPRWCLSSSDSGVAQVTSSGLAVATGHIPVSPAVAILKLAPKTSPPASRA